ncbi:hypothetical protein Tco_1346257 [Tanacetum coccineum]
MIATSSSRYSSNDIVHNHYLEEAKKKTQEHSRNSRNFSDSKHFVCSTCQKCVFNANHDSCVTKFLKEVNSRAKVPSNKTTNRNKPVEQIRVATKPNRQIPTGHRILKTVYLRWVPTGKIFTSSTTKVDSEPPNGSKEDITNQCESEQALDVSADISENRASRNFDMMINTMMSDHNSSDLAPQRQMASAKNNTSGPIPQCLNDVCSHQFRPHSSSMTSDHNRSELRIHDHSIEQSSSKLVPKVKTVASDTTIQKSKSYHKELYENTNQEWKWWIAKRCPSGYKWTQKPLRTKKIWMPKIRKEDVSTSISPTIDIVSRITNIVQLILFIVDSGCTKHMTGNLKLLCNFMEKFLGTVRFGNDQFAPILGYGDLNQGNVTIKRVYYVEGLNHNLFSVGQFCDADLEVAFRKSTCFVRDLQGNDFTNWFFA